MSYRATLTILPLILASLTILPTVPIARVPDAQANPVQYTLWGHTFFGWGSTQAEITVPGPTLEAGQGEMVDLTLFSADAPIGHTFGVDYNGNGFLDVTEEETGFFNSKTAGFMASITANSTHPGTYTYWCGIHLGNMKGTFIVNPTAAIHDVAVTGVSASRSFAYAGVSSQPVKVDVTVANQGSTSETSTVTARAGASIIGTLPVTVAAGGSTMVTFNWDAHLFTQGTYPLSAEVSQVSGETDLLDNSLTGATFTVRFAGDVNNDCTVNVSDLARVGASFLKSTGQPGFDSEADLNNDGTVNVLDLVVVGANFLKSCV